VSYLDLATVDPNLKGFLGGFSDGTYSYLVPYEDSVAHHGNVARIDLNDFSSSGVSSLDLTTVDPSLKGFYGGFSHGTYGYFVPYYNGAFHGKVVRIDLTNFAASGVSYLDLATVDANLKGFVGGFTDGTYGYFVPFKDSVAHHGNVARINLTDFSASGVSYLDLTTVDPNLKGFRGGFTDGTYGYFVPYQDSVAHGNVARIDLTDFSASGVSYLDLTTVDANLKGFIGGFTDGTYGYFVPWNDGTEHGNVVRVDLTDFSASGVSNLDLTTVDANLKGFIGGFSDGTYGYLVPYDNGAKHGNVVRLAVSSHTPGIGWASSP